MINSLVEQTLLLRLCCSTTAKQATAAVAAVRGLSLTLCWCIPASTASPPPLCSYLRRHQGETQTKIDVAEELHLCYLTCLLNSFLLALHPLLSLPCLPFCGSSLVPAPFTYPPYLTPIGLEFRRLGLS